MRTTARLTGFVAVFAAVFAFFAAPAFAAETLHEGTWTKKNYKASGTWSIVEEDDGSRFVVLSDDFKTRNAPDLKLFLSPRTVEDLENGNATSGSFFIAELKKNKGGQRYKLDDSVDLSEFESIIIHCEKYTKLWSAAAL